MSIVLLPGSLNRQRFKYLGTKGKYLFELSQSGQRVPFYFVISSEAFDRACLNPNLNNIRNILCGVNINNKLSLQAGSESLQNLIKTSTLDKHVQNEISRTYSQFFSPDDYVAVRSSALAEDSEDHSFAGQLESFLFVKGEQALIEAIKKCWASVFSPRALAYNFLHKLDPTDIHLAVIVQRMVFAKTSGVIFTADPVSGRRDVITINATLGLGASLVSGSIEGDTFHINKQTQTIAKNIGSKERMSVLNHRQGHGIIEMQVPSEQQTIPCLTISEVLELSKIGILIEKKYGKPQDIEWAINNNGIFILQTRPITTLPKVSHSRTIVWDNSNIIESYSGVTSPLTFSFAREAYSAVYSQAARLVGIPKKTISINNELFESMIGIIKGRIYYNLNSWYQGLSLVPGFKYNKVFMEQMMGVKEALDWTDNNNPTGMQKLLDLFNLGRVALRILYDAMLIQGRVTAFQNMVNSVCGEYDRKKFSGKEIYDLIVNYYDLRRRLLWNWQTPIVNDFLTAGFYGVLRKLITRYNLDETGTLQNDLLCGEGDILSVEPAKSIIIMAEIVRSDDALLTLFQTKSDRQLCESLLQEANKNVLATKFKDHLDRFGYRCVHELKLEEPSLKDDPTPLIGNIRSYLPRLDLNLELLEKREQEVRSRAENLISSKLRGRRPTFLAFRYMFFQFILERTRMHVRNRENMRFSRTRVFGLVRNLFNSVGKKLQDIGLLDNPYDIFYLEVQEILGLSRGTVTGNNLKGLVKFRKQEFQRYREEESPPDRFETTGVIEQSSNALKSITTEVTNSDTILKGQGCCPGVARGIVKLFNSIDDDHLEKGDILVAKETDPGWIPIFPLASGLLIERGSILSHSAIVAREAGIPAIVGIHNLTKTIKSGQYVEMDGSTGTIKIIDKFDEPEVLYDSK